MTDTCPLTFEHPYHYQTGKASVVTLVTPILDVSYASVEDV